MPLLEVEDLQVDFDTPGGPVHAVRGLSFGLERGETLGIVGESGSGKTQVALSVMGLLADNARVQGSVRLEGAELLGLPAARLDRIRGARIAMVFQDPLSALNPYLKVGTQVTEILRRHKGLGAAAARRRTLELFDAVRIPGAARRIDQYPHEFSGGMRQRVLLAMALSCEPDVLLADEPTTALDVTVQAQVLDLLRELGREFDTATVLVTHDLGIVAGMCERVLVMYAGRVVEHGPVDDLFEAPLHPYTAGLLDSVPRLDQVAAGRLRAIPGQPPDPRRAPGGCAFEDRCQHRFERCTAERPRLRGIRPGHEAACHLDQGVPR